MQLESDIHLTPTISVDGKCANPPNTLRDEAEKDNVNTLEIIIDGNILMGGLTPSTLLGQCVDYLPTSRRFKLVKIKDLGNGRCCAKYKKVE